MLKCQEICALNDQSFFVLVQWIKGYASEAVECPLCVFYSASKTNVLFRTRMSSSCVVLFEHILFTLGAVCFCGSSAHLS